MARLDSIQKSINKIEEYGRENQKLIPQFQGWCTHLKIEGYAQGMVAQMAGLPNNVRVSCPHASSPGDWIKLSVVAEEFIENNCISCSFHKSLHEPNYGQTLLEKITTRKKEQIENYQLKLELARKVIQETDALVRDGKQVADQTQLSILKLVAELTSVHDRKTTAEHLLAAAKLSPEFFSDAALDVLLIYMDDEHVGAECIDAAYQVMEGRGHPSPKAFILAKEQINTSPHFDHLSKLLSCYIDKDNIAENTTTIDILLNRLWYKRHPGESNDPTRNFCNSEALLINIGRNSPESLEKIFRKRLAINEKNQRININLLFQKLILDLPDLIASLTSEIIHSLELDDDEYEQSADFITIQTLVAIFNIFPDQTLKILNSEKPKLSRQAQAILPSLSIQLLSDRAFSDRHPNITDLLVTGLVDGIFNKNVPEQIQKEIMSKVAYFIGDRPELFQNSFDAFLGYLSKVAEDDSTFKYFRDELKNKQPLEYATFNYLVGKNFWEIKEIEQSIQRRYQNTKKIIGELCKAAPDQNLTKLYSIIRNLDSIKHETYKKELIFVIKNYGKSPATLASFIPQLYQHLLDPDSLNIRYASMQLMDVLFDKFPALITTSLWDLFDIFIKDKQVIVQGMALDILGTIGRRFPERVSEEHLKIHREALKNSKVFIHTNAVRISRILYPMMTSRQHYEVTTSLLQLAEVYENEEQNDSFSSITDQLFFYVSEQPEVVYKIASRFIIPKTKSSEYYVAIENIKKLKALIKKNPNVSSLWLGSVLSLLIRFPYDGGSQDDRLNFYNEMHHIDRKAIMEHKPLFRELITLRRNSSQTHFDVAHSLIVLGYFECYDFIEELVVVLQSQYLDVESNKNLLRHVNYWRFLAASETALDKMEKTNNLKAAEDVFKPH